MADGSHIGLCGVSEINPNCPLSNHNVMCKYEIDRIKTVQYILFTRCTARKSKMADGSHTGLCGVPESNPNRPLSDSKPLCKYELDWIKTFQDIVFTRCGTEGRKDGRTEGQKDSRVLSSG